jgi:molybdopterin-guanine dinucleotide biosynthesis protein A
MNEERIAGLVLAGGAARRMGGGDKPLLTVGGQPMLASVIAALGVRPIAISANGDPARFAAFGLPVLPDGAFQGQGPLAGLLAGLRWAAALGMASLLTAPGDTPFLPSGLAARLRPAPCCAASDGRRHHLVALWPVSCANTLHSLLSTPGSRRVGDFCERIGMRNVEFAVRSGDPFANVNTADELDLARLIAREGGADRGGADRGGADRGGADRGGADRGGADRGGAGRGDADRGDAEGPDEV